MEEMPLYKKLRKHHYVVRYLSYYTNVMAFGIDIFIVIYTNLLANGGEIFTLGHWR